MAEYMEGILNTVEGKTSSKGKPYYLIMSVHIEVAHHGDNGSYIKAQLNNDKGMIWIEATDPKHPEWRTTAFLTDDQAEQIADKLDEYLVAVGRRDNICPQDDGDCLKTK